MTKNLSYTTICFLFLSVNLIGILRVNAQTILVDTGAEWKYLDDGSDQGTAWLNPSFDDSPWAAGAAQLGYGDGDEATVVSYGTDPNNKYITTYFRHSFTVSDPSQFPGLSLELLRDDGAVVYLNGIEIERSNMPADQITYLTPAASSVSGNENTFVISSEDPANLISGTNVIAVEVHQESGSSSDISFDLRLISSIHAPDVMRKAPYLIFNGNYTEMQAMWQLFSSQSCTIEWGTDRQYTAGYAQTSEYGDDHQHSYTIGKLIPDTRYYYRVTVNGDAYENSFRSAPDPQEKSVKFFVYGDTRSQPDAHDKVAAGMVAASREDEDLHSIILAVGDLVSEGDMESLWDEDFFNPVYSNIQKMLASLPYQSCMGNHERDGVLYTKYFPYPFEAERYWSFDYGPVHFIVVDQYTDYTPGSAQLAWIESDLAASTAAWNFFLLHEPGWSAGTHGNEADVQNYIQPLCEKYNVHVVFTGHNHNYARAIVNNVHHITTGGGGAPLYDPDLSSPNIVTATKAHHFCKVEIKGRHLSVTAIDTTGTIIDAFSIEDPSLPVDVSVFPSDTLDFGEVFTGFKDTLQLKLLNTGYDILQISNVSISGEGFVTPTDTLHIEMGDSAAIPVIFSPQADNTYSAAISIFSNDSDNPQITIELTGKGILPPDIAISPDSLSQSLAFGDTARQVLTISNLGSKDLLFEISAVDQSQGNLQTPLPGWLQMDTLSASIPPFSKMDIGITFDAAGLDTGRYHSDILVRSNDPNKQEVRLPAELSIYGVPDISLSDTLLQFLNISLGFQATDTLTISNMGTALLSISDISSDNKSFRTDTTLLAVLPGEQYPLAVTFSADTLGNSPGSLTIISNDPDDSSAVVKLLGESVLPPMIAVTPDSLTEYLTSGDSARQVLTISNLGAKDLLFEISAAGQSQGNLQTLFPTWLQLDTLSGRILPFSKMEIGITFNAAGLDTGRYQSEILILSNDPEKQEVHLPAELAVSGIPYLSLSDTLLQFMNISLGSSATDTLTLSNIGTGHLSISDISSDNKSFRTDTSSLSLVPGERYHLQVTFSADSLGSSPGRLTIRSNDPGHPLMLVDLLGESVLPPMIAVTPDSLSEYLARGDTARQVLILSNLGSKDLLFEISASGQSQGNAQMSFPGWLQIDTLAGRILPFSNMEIGVTFDATGLDTGRYQSEIIISSSDPHLPELHIPAGLTVSGFPEILVSLSSLHDSLETGQSFTEHMNIRNRGEAPLIFYILCKLNDTSVNSGNVLPAESPGHSADIDSGNENMTVASRIKETMPGSDRGRISSSDEKQSDRLEQVAHDKPAAPVFNLPAVQGNRTLQDSISAGLTWLTVSPDSGVITAGDSLEIKISGDFTGLGTGLFEAQISIYCNDPNDEEISIPVFIKVIPSATEDAFSLKIPKTYELHQNYPNPFNPSTYIRYGVPKTSWVKIEIYNVIGQLIITLLDEKKEAGYHQVEFNAQNLPSGIYLYLLKADSYQEAKKMLLIK